MTKYELLYGVTVDSFPNERENVKRKLFLAEQRYAAVYMNMEPGEKKDQLLHELNEAIKWANKILRDIHE